jgi:hypothetical protein
MYRNVKAVAEYFADIVTLWGTGAEGSGEFERDFIGG